MRGTGVELWQRGPRVGARPSPRLREEGEKQSAEKSNRLLVVALRRFLEGRPRNEFKASFIKKRKNFRLLHEQTDSLFAKTLRPASPHLSEVLQHSFGGEGWLWAENTTVFVE